MSVRICNELKKTSSTLTGGRLQEEDLIFIGVELEDNFYEAQFKLAWNSFFWLSLSKMEWKGSFGTLL